MESVLPLWSTVAVAIVAVTCSASAQEPLEPARRLYAPALVVSETHVGLTGFVLDSNGVAVVDAEIRAFPDATTLSDESLMRRSHHYTRSGDRGGFFMPLAPGWYAVRVNRPGLTVTTVHVVVPATGGRCIAVWLVAPRTHAVARDETCAGL